MNSKQIEAVLLQSLERELGGVKVYETAIDCVEPSDLKAELEECLTQARTRVTVIEEICRFLKLDPRRDTPGRKVVRSVAESLVEVMKLAKSAGDPVASEIVARESVVLTEEKDELDWDLLGRCAGLLRGKVKVRKSAAEATAELDDGRARLSLS